MAWKAQRLPSNGGKGSRNSCGLHPWYFKDLSSTVSFDCVPWNLFKKIKWATHKTATTHIRVVRSKVRSLQGPLESGSYDPLGIYITEGAQQVLFVCVYMYIWILNDTHISCYYTTVVYFYCLLDRYGIGWSQHASIQLATDGLLLITCQWSSS